MPKPDEVQRLRKEVGDANAVETLYRADPDFRATVDRYKAVMTNMSPVAEAKFPTAMLNKHYLKTFSPTKPVSPFTNQLANNVVASGRVSQAQVAKQSILDPNSVQDPSLMGFGQNILKSGGRMIRDIGTAIANPIDTVTGLGKAALGAGINTVETITGNEDTFNNPFGSEDVASGIGQFYVDRYGSLEGLRKTAYEDPVGLISDVASVLTGAGAAIKGGASLASLGVRASTAGGNAVKVGSTAAKIGKAASVAGKFGDDLARAGVAAEPVFLAGKAAKGIVKGAGNAGKFAVAQATGLAPDTISTIAKNQKFGDASITRTGLGEKVKGAIQGLQDEVSDTGKTYQSFREGKQVAKVKPSFFRDHLKKQGFKFDDTGKLFDSIEGPKLSASEIGELNSFLKTVDDLGETMTDNQFLRVRERLSKLAKFEKATRSSNDIESIAKGLREALNTEVRPGFKGLDELDARYAPQRELLDQFERDFIDPRTGDLKDNAISRIATMTGKGKEQLLDRVKTLIPGIEEEVNALRAMEDVQLAGGNKVGTYTRGAIGGFALSGGNPVGAIAGAILATPSISTRIIRGYGKVAGLGGKTVSGILNKLKLGQKLTAEEAAIMSAALQWAETQDSLSE